MAIRCRRRTVHAWVRVLWAGCLAVCLGALANSAAGQITMGQAGDAPLGDDEGRIYNIASSPFTFRLERSAGPTWTQSYTLPPNRYFSIKLPKPGQRSELVGVLGNREGYVVIQYPELGGQMSFRLPARNPQSNELEPTWFHVEDSDAISWLVQAGSVENARKIQEDLQQKPRRTPEEIERLRRNLEANWCLSLPQDASGARGGPGWRCCP